MLRKVPFSKRALALILLAILPVSCGDIGLAPMPEPDLSSVAEPELLKQVQQARAAVAAAPRQAASWAWLGHVYYLHGWREEAVPCYRNAAALEADSFSYLYYLGRALVESDPARAVTALEQALTLRPSYAPAHIYSAYALRSLGRGEEARDRFERAAQLDPDNWVARLGLGQLAFERGDLQVARHQLMQALGLNGRAREVHAALAQVATTMEQEEAARQHAEAARRFPPGATMRDSLWRRAEAAGATRAWHSKRGERHLSQGDFAAALDEFSQVVAGQEANPRQWCNYGSALLGVGRIEEAIAALEKALSQASAPDLPDDQTQRILNALGQAHMQAGAFERAEQYLQQALEMDFDTLPVVANLALVYYYQDRLDDAIHFLQNARGADRHPNTAGLLDELLRKRLQRIAR